MKAHTQTRSAALAGLLLLATLVLLTIAQSASAGANYPSYGGATGSVKLPPAEVLGRLHPTASVVSNGAVVAATTAGVGPGEVAIRPVVVVPFEVSQSAPSRFSLSESGPGSGTSPTGFSATPSVSSSTSVWIAVAAFAGGLAIILWMFARGRIRRREPSFDCSATLLGC